MRLCRLELHHFRNLKNQSVEFPGRVSILIGMNGQGKTNLLEAIYVLAQAKSFRSCQARDLASWNAGAEAAPGISRSSEARYAVGFVHGEVSTESGFRSLRFELHDGKRQIFLNDKRISKASHFYGQLTAVSFTPDDLQLIKGPPAVRRSFIDRTLAMCDSSYAESLVRYQRALRSRHSVLAALRSDPCHGEKMRAALDPWDETLIEEGRRIAERRLNLVQELAASAAEHYYYFSASSSSESQRAVLDYLSDFIEHRAVLESKKCEELFIASSAQDVRVRRTRIGVHRDELRLLLPSAYGLQSARRAASQGQTRSLALALVFSALDFLKQKNSESPLLLLDDVESELDDKRRSALYELIHQLENQVFITATHLSSEVKQTLRGSNIMLISNGLIIEQK